MINSAVCHLQAASKAQLECSAAMVWALGKVQSDGHKLKEQLAPLTTADADREYLATFRDPLRKWLARQAKAHGVPWPILAGELDLEEDEVSQPYTDMLKASLQHDNYTWEDWHAVQSIADAANCGFYSSKKVGAADALQKLECAAQTNCQIACNMLRLLCEKLSRLSSQALE